MPAYGAFPVRFQTSPRLTGSALLFATVLGVGCGSPPVVRRRAGVAALGRVDPQQALRSGAEGRRPGASSATALMALQCAPGTARCWSSPACSSRASPTRAAPIPASASMASSSPPTIPPARWRRATTLRASSRPTCSSGCSALPVDRVGRPSPTQMPLDIHGLPSRGFRLEGRARDHAAAGNGAQQHRVARPTSRTLGIPIVSPGEDFAGLMTRHGARPAGDCQRGVRAPLHRRPPICLAAGSQNGDTTDTIAGVVKNST